MVFLFLRKTFPLFLSFWQISCMIKGHIPVRGWVRWKRWFVDDAFPTIAWLFGAPFSVDSLRRYS
jgi:hypothetical protein